MLAPARTPTAELDDPALYINRELSLLEFNRRVLEQARDTTVPLLERLRFLAICSTNLDEFFEIRVAGLRQQVASGVASVAEDGSSAQETLRRISTTAHELVEQQYRVLNDELMPALAAEGIRLLKRAEWSGSQAAWIKRYFTSDVLPVLTPMGLDPAHPFPRVLNKGLNFIISLEGRDAFGRASGRAILQVPRSLWRVIMLPKRVAVGPDDFVLLSSVIHAHVEQLFPGMKVKGCWQFRLTRNSDLWVDEEEVENLLQALKGELPLRNFGAAVRLEVAENCPDEISQFLLDEVQLQRGDFYQVNGPVNLHRLQALHEMVDRPDLKYRPFAPKIARRLDESQDIFETLSDGDVLLHHPFESFAPVMQLVKQAAADPNVLAIKQTLYRTGADSPLVDALIDAARAGKEVTAVVELRARFDEAANMNLAARLQEVGANVVYGVVGFKAHAKMLMVVRREGRRLRRYCHLGTGNYHARTARAYTDMALMTANPEIGEDVHQLFMQLTSLGKVTRLKKVVQSPFTLHDTLVKLIDAESAAAQRGEPARIMAKMNALSEPVIIQALYRASQAGVPIDLVVRGICCLRPGIPGVSDTITVRSIVGRFLEHSRVFCFHAGGKELTLLSSADWMQRNFFRRVETAFPIEDPGLRARAITEGIAVYMADNVQSWLLQSDGTYKRCKPGKDKARSAQDVLLLTLAG